MKNSASSFVLLLGIASAFSAWSWHDTTASAPAQVKPPSSTHSHGVPSDLGRNSTSPTAGAMKISADKQQVIGVRVSPVERAAATQALRVFGRVAPDETRVYRLNAGIEGFIRDVAPVTTGSQVKKDQLLATFSAPAALSTIQLYILNLGAVDRLKQAAAAGSVEAQAAPAGASNVQQRVDQLQNLGMSVLQMEEIARSRQMPESIKILAPADGFVLARNVSPGLKFDKGSEFYRIADLRRVWILADVFENEAQYLRPGVRAQVSLPSQRKTLPVRVSEILPQFDPITRTLKVRLEADNPGYVLRPDMFVDVELEIGLPPMIAVPADAVIDSGLAKTVFIERGEGIFEARDVETGWRLGDRVEIVKGLSPGERIVTSGAFLVDSESRLRPSVTGAAPSRSVAPVPTGHEHGAHGDAGHGQAIHGDTERPAAHTPADHSR